MMQKSQKIPVDLHGDKKLELTVEVTFYLITGLPLIDFMRFMYTKGLVTNYGEGGGLQNGRRGGGM